MEKCDKCGEHCYANVCVLRHVNSRGCNFEGGEASEGGKGGKGGKGGTRPRTNPAKYRPSRPPMATQSKKPATLTRYGPLASLNGKVPTQASAV